MLQNMPVPVPDHDTKEFWDACGAGELALPSCSNCSHFRWPPGPMCPRCQTLGTKWVLATGEGEVYSWTVVWNPPGPGLDADLPYVVALVEMPEGPRLVGNILDCLPDDVFAGMRVRTVFEHVTGQTSIYNFQRITDNDN